MKKEKQQNLIKKKSQRPSTILMLILIFIGFTAVASYKSAPASPLPVEYVEKTDEVVVPEKKSKEELIADLAGKITENNRIETLLKYYDNHVFGIDVSHYQGLIDWENLEHIKDSIPVGFVFMRASVGWDTADKHFAKNWAAAGEKNLIRGAYHYYRPDENSTRQARNFISKVKLNPGDLPPVLDIEALPKRQSISSLRKGITNWLNIIESHYGVKPIIYTGDTFYEHFLAGHGFDEYEFWIANYNPVPEPFHPDWNIWQFSMKGRIAGISTDVDLNVFNGNEAKLQQMRITS